MEKILILSDTHGNLEMLNRVVSLEKDAGTVFHLGDNYDDLDEVKYLLFNKQVYRVPGIFHPGYLDKSISGILKLELEGWQILLVHNVEDVLNREIEADLVFYGHTHNWKVQKMNETYFINPGHMKDNSHKNKIASYCIIDLYPEMIDITIKDINSKELKREIIKRSILEDI